MSPMNLPELGEWQPGVDNDDAAAVPERKGDIDQLFSFWSINDAEEPAVAAATSWLFFLLRFVAWYPYPPPPPPEQSSMFSSAEWWGEEDEAGAPRAGDVAASAHANRRLLFPPALEWANVKGDTTSIFNDIPLLYVIIVLTKEERKIVETNGGYCVQSAPSKKNWLGCGGFQVKFELCFDQIALFWIESRLLLLRWLVNSVNRQYDWFWPLDRSASTSRHVRVVRVYYRRILERVSRKGFLLEFGARTRAILRRLNSGLRTTPYSIEIRCYLHC